MKQIDKDEFLQALQHAAGSLYDERIEAIIPNGTQAPYFVFMADLNRQLTQQLEDHDDPDLRALLNYWDKIENQLLSENREWSIETGMDEGFDTVKTGYEFKKALRKVLPGTFVPYLDAVIPDDARASFLMFANTLAALLEMSDTDWLEPVRDEFDLVLSSILAIY